MDDPKTTGNHEETDQQIGDSTGLVRLRSNSQKGRRKLRKPDNEYRLVVIGRTGEGKSSTGNSIFGRKVFKASATAKSVTPKCVSHKESVKGKQVLVADTPGLFDTEREYEEVRHELLKFIAITAPGPHAILLVMRIGRFSKEVNDTYMYVKELLGYGGNNYTIVVFTGGDDLVQEEVTIEEYLQDAPTKLKEIVAEAGGRYVVFNNKAKGKEQEKQVNALLGVIDTMQVLNLQTWYKSAVYEDAEEALQEKEDTSEQALTWERNEKIVDLEAQVIASQKMVEELEKTEGDNKKLIEQKRNEVANAEKKYEEIQTGYEERLASMRDNLRKDIESDNVNISDPWFRSKLVRAGQLLKSVLGL